MSGRDAWRSMRQHSTWIIALLSPDGLPVSDVAVEFRSEEIRRAHRSVARGREDPRCSRKRENVEDVLEELLPLELGRELARKVFSERSQFEQNLALGAFKLDSQAVTLEPGSAGRVRVRVPVQELPGGGALHRYELGSGGAVVARNFQAAGKDGRRIIEEEMELPAGAEYLTVRVVDAGTNTRSYTLRVPQGSR